MTDIIDLIPADLLPEAAKEYITVLNDLAWQGMGLHNLGDEVWETLDKADAAFRAALDIVASLMVCGTCVHIDTCELHFEDGYLWAKCHFEPPEWQHYRDGEA